jgi:cell wall-associated NlpC family hydrolase
MSASREAARIARTWLGTPFVAGASLAGVGTDCAGLVEGIAHDLGIEYPHRSAVEHDFARAAAKVLVPTHTAITGTLILLSKDPAGPPIHGAIVTDAGTIIHAHWRAGVVENRFGNWFKRRITHFFGQNPAL